MRAESLTGAAEGTGHFVQESSQIASSQRQPLPATGALERLRDEHNDQIPVTSIPEPVREEVRNLAVPVDFVCRDRGKRI